MKSKKPDSSRVSEAVTDYGRSTVLTLKKPKAQVSDNRDENQWMLDDRESDDKALIKLSDFLVHRGYRKCPSSCDDAIETIERLETEIIELKRKISKRS